jgi:hypothetical protein
VWLKLAIILLLKTKSASTWSRELFWKISEKMATFGGNVFLKIFKIFAWRILGGFLALVF